MTKLVDKIIEVAFHRNGVSGIPFTAVRFISNGAIFLAILTSKTGECYVICTTILDKHGVSFGNNSWRGDHYEPELREAVKQWQSEIAL